MKPMLPGRKIKSGLFLLLPILVGLIILTPSKARAEAVCFPDTPTNPCHNHAPGWSTCGGAPDHRWGCDQACNKVDLDDVWCEGFTLRDCLDGEIVDEPNSPSCGFSGTGTVPLGGSCQQTEDCLNADDNCGGVFCWGNKCRTQVCDLNNCQSIGTGDTDTVAHLCRYDWLGSSTNFCCPSTSIQQCSVQCCPWTQSACGGKPEWGNLGDGFGPTTCLATQKLEYNDCNVDGARNRVCKNYCECGATTDRAGTACASAATPTPTQVPVSNRVIASSVCTNYRTNISFSATPAPSASPQGHLVRALGRKATDPVPSITDFGPELCTSIYCADNLNNKEWGFGSNLGGDYKVYAVFRNDASGVGGWSAPVATANISYRPADIDGGGVGQSDLGLLNSCYSPLGNASGNCQLKDLSCDNIVNALDYSILLTNWD